MGGLASIRTPAYSCERHRGHYPSAVHCSRKTYPRSRRDRRGPRALCVVRDAPIRRPRCPRGALNHRAGREDPCPPRRVRGGRARRVFEVVEREEVAERRGQDGVGSSERSRPANSREEVVDEQNQCRGCWDERKELGETASLP